MAPPRRSSRRQPPPSAAALVQTSTSTSTSNKSAPKRSSGARLARENDLSTEEEGQIREAFRIFAQNRDDEDNDGEEEEGEDEDEYAGEGVMATGDVRRALIALSLPPTTPAELRSIISTLDPLKTGQVTYPHFLSVCALKLQQAAAAAAADEPESEKRRSEVEAAFRLFTGGAQGPITVAHLRRVARELRLGEDEVGEEMLREMILEANGGAGVSRGVGREEFEGVMRRAGVF